MGEGSEEMLTFSPSFTTFLFNISHRLLPVVFHLSYPLQGGRSPSETIFLHASVISRLIIITVVVISFPCVESCRLPHCT